MKAIVFENYGKPEVLKLKNVEKPSINNNEILIRNHATSVTSGDARLRRADPFISRIFTGIFKPNRRPTLGVTFAGIIEEIGANVTNWRPGDRVFGSNDLEMGCYAEYVKVKDKCPIVKIPEGISFEEAATTPFGGSTSLHFLKKANIKSGDKVLIYGASGSLGTAAVQLAKYYGAEVTGVCSSANVELVRSLRANHVIDYTQEKFYNNSVSYDIIYDTVGKSPFRECVKSLTLDGKYLRAVHIAPGVVFQGIWINLTSKKRVIGGMNSENVDHLNILANLLAIRKYKPVISQTYNLDEMASAHKLVDSGHKIGNIAITIK